MKPSQKMSMVGLALVDVATGKVERQVFYTNVNKADMVEFLAPYKKTTQIPTVDGIIDFINKRNDEGFIAVKKTADNKLLHEYLCPHCSAKLNAHSSNSGDDGAPKDGNFLVCFHCLTILRFVGSDMSLAQATNEELATFKKEEPNGYSLLMRAVDTLKKSKQHIN